MAKVGRDRRARRIPALGGSGGPALPKMPRMLANPHRQAYRADMVHATTPTDWDHVAQRIEEVRNLARAFAGEAREHFGKRLRDIRLFGSAARDDWQEDSEIDREGIPL